MHNNLIKNHNYTKNCVNFQYCIDIANACLCFLRVPVILSVTPFPKKILSLLHQSSPSIGLVLCQYQLPGSYSIVL